jgi:hypothetical protein
MPPLKAIRMVRRAWLDFMLMRPDTYLRPMAQNSNKKSERITSSAKKFKVVLPKTWSSSESVI